MKYLHKITLVLLIVGGLNLMLMAFGVFDIGQYLGDTGTQFLYVAIGVSAIYEILSHMGRCKECGGKK